MTISSPLWFISVISNSRTSLLHKGMSRQNRRFGVPSTTSTTHDHNRRLPQPALCVTDRNWPSVTYKSQRPITLPRLQRQKRGDATSQAMSCHGATVPLPALFSQSKARSAAPRPPSNACQRTSQQSHCFDPTSPPSYSATAKPLTRPHPSASRNFSQDRSGLIMSIVVVKSPTLLSSYSTPIRMAIFTRKSSNPMHGEQGAAA